MIIKYKGKEFHINNDRLAVRKAATPLIVKYRTLRTEYFKDLDRAFIDEYDKQINKYSLAIEQVKLKNPNDKISDSDNRTYGEYLIELDEKLKNAIDTKNNDERVSIVLQAEAEIESMIYLQLICYTDLMYNLYNEMTGDISIIDVNDDDYEQFALGVLAGFFEISFASLLKSMNSKKITP